MVNTIVQSFIRCSLAAILMFLFSCNVYFDSPQPSWIKKNQKELPATWRGNFVSGTGIVHDLYGENGDDTIRISEKRIFVDKEFDYTLSDTVLLKKYKQDYFLNIYSREDNVWIVMLVKEAGKDIYFYMMTTESEQEERISRLREITDVREMSKKSDQSDDYIINPSHSEFRKILRSNMFTSGDTLLRAR